MDKKIIIRTILFIIGGILGIIVLYHLYLSYLPELKLLFNFDHHNEELLIKLVRSHGFEDLAFIFILNALCVAIPGLSNGVFCILNGVLFGPGLGFIINWISDILGQIILLVCLKKLYNPKKLEHSKIYKLIVGQSYPQFSLTIGYMLSFIPSATVAYANNLINHTFKKCLIPIIIGSLPMAYLYAYGGDSILHLNSKRIIVTISIFVIIMLLAFLSLIGLRKFKNSKKDLDNF